jgi:hypothetical protein
MAQYRNTKDIVTRILKKTGEPTNGNSSYEASVTEYISDVQRKLVAGATIFNLDCDETWPWARSQHPHIIEVLPSYKTGTVALTNENKSGVFSSAPSYSVAGWFIRNPTTKEAYRIISHGAGSANFVLETHFLGATTTAWPFEAYKLDYEILSSYIFVPHEKNTILFSENGTTQVAATIAAGSYTLGNFASAWQTAANLVCTANITVTYNTTRRLFTFSSDGATFQIIGERGSNPNSGMSLAGFDELDYTGALSYTGSYPFGSVSRIVEPIRFIANADGGELLIEGQDPLTFAQNFTYRSAQEGTPTYFTKIGEDNSGKITIRLNNFPDAVGRLEVTAMPSPVDLHNNANSVPLLPPRDYNILEYAGCYFIMLEKEDSKKDEFVALAKAEIQTMQKHYRGEQFRTTGHFGYVAPRGPTRYIAGRRYGYDKDNY